MRSISLLLLLFITLPASTAAQIPATTEEGRRVLLYENGSWSYAGEEETSSTTYVHTGNGNRLEAGIREEVFNNIELQVAVEEGAPRLIIWKEYLGDCQPGVRAEFFGEASLLLGNAAVPLVDRGKTGRQTVTEEESGYSRTLTASSANSYCETWGMYHLTRAELKKLRGNPLSKLRIEWESQVRTRSEIVHVKENRWTLRRQIEALDL